MPQMFYSMSLDAVVVLDLIEDPTLAVPMKLTQQGILYVKGQFIEETRSYGFPPIPDPVGSTTYDVFSYYTPSASIIGLNSGSNEWSNRTPLAAYFARNTWLDVQEWDAFTTYTVGNPINGENSGSGAWSGVYPYVSRYVTAKTVAVWDLMNDLGLNANPNGSSSGETYSGSSWVDPYASRTLSYGIFAYDIFSNRTVDTSVSASTPPPDSRYSGFDYASRVILNISGSI